jgi:hypothetical protein
MFADAVEYSRDAVQRSILFLDVMRQRGHQYEEQAASHTPNVLDYDCELVCDGRRLERPVNYVLVRILPSEDMEIDPRKRPFVVVDPRAGTGRVLAASRPTVKSASRSKPGIPAISSASCPIPCPVKRFMTSPAPKPFFLKW